VADLIDRLKLTAADERNLKAYFYEDRETINDAIDKVDGYKTARGLRNYLSAQVGPADAVMLAWKKLRLDPDIRAMAEKVVKKGAFTVRELGDVMDQAQRAGTKAMRMLEYLDKLSDSKAVGKEKVVADLAKGHNFYTGAEWVLRWITENGMWDAVKRFEVESEIGGRRWDAQIGGNLYQFKAWSKFWDRSFLKQMLQDYKQSGGFKKFLVKWVMEGKLGDVEAVKTMMREALDDALDKGKEGWDAKTVKAVKAALDDIVIQ
jgi:hypothetical protein